MADGSYDDDRESMRKSYSYVRAAMVALLVGLAVAVFYESDWRGPYLDSVSGYYYTPAQAMFVGGLVGLGACMIALRGTNTAEDIFLNLGGMFAAVVAIVPTSRGADHRTAIRECRALAEEAPEELDCPSREALETATRLDIENNMVALLVLGALGLLATVFIMWSSRDKRRRDDPGASPAKAGKGFWVGLPVALAVWAAGAVVFGRERQWFIDYAHIVAAISMAACVLVVVCANAWRHRKRGRSNFYKWYAVFMVAATGTMAILLQQKVVTLFWLEMVVAGLFIVFWVWQTVERARAPVSAGASLS